RYPGATARFLGQSFLLAARARAARQRLFQSALIPAARIGFAQRSISAGRYLARYSGVRRSGATISRPSSSSRVRTVGSSSMSLIALLSLRTIGSGVPLGRKKAFQTLASTP